MPAPSAKNFSGPSLANAIRKHMDKMEAKFRRAFIGLIESLTTSPEFKQVLAMIRDGQYTAITPDLLQAIDAITIDATTLRNLSRQAMSGSARVTASQVGIEGVFDITNPRAIEFARSLSSDLVTNVTRAVRENLREIIADAVEGNASMTEVVRRVKNEVGLTSRDAAAVRNYRRQLRAAGKSVQEANALAQKYTARLLKERAKTIARTEIARAVSYGQQEFWQQMKDQQMIPPTALRVWITADDEKVCEVCGPLDGKTAPIDGMWNTAAGSFDIAHAHPNCRCTSGLVFTNKVKKIDPHAYDEWLLEKAKGSGGLAEWFREEWVDLSRPKKGGGFEPCGRRDASEGKYPKCVPASRAAKMTDAEIRSAIRRKRRAETMQSREGKKPIMVPTISKASVNVPVDEELYARIKSEARRKFDVYPSAYANAWLVQEYKRRGGKYKTVSKGDYPGHPFRGNQWTGGMGRGSAGGRGRAVAPDKAAAPKKGKREPFAGSKRHGGTEYLAGADGSFLDFVDWDDPSYHPVQQLLDMAVEELPFDEIETDFDFDDVDVELLAEVLDGLAAAAGEWPGVRAGALKFEFDSPGAGGAALAGEKGVATFISINSRAVMKGRQGTDFIDTWRNSQTKDSNGVAWNAQSPVSPAQAIAIHEFGHAVHYTLAYHCPDLLWQIERAVAGDLVPTMKFEASPHPAGKTATSPFPTVYWRMRSSVFTRMMDNASPSQRKAMMQAVSEYGTRNGAEVWAELFVTAYTELPKRLRGPQRTMHRTIEMLWDKILKRIPAP